MAKLILSLLLLSLAQHVLCQEDPVCDDLEVDNDDEAMPGDDLPYCKTPDKQCCTAEYLNDVREELIEDLKESLEEEFEDSAEDYEEILERILGYFTDDFAEDFIDSLPLGVYLEDNALEGPIEMFEDNVLIVENSTYSVANFVDQIFVALKELGINGSTDPTHIACVENAVDDNINEDEVTKFVDALEEVRMSLTSAFEIVDFLEDFVADLGGFEPLPECITALIEISFCGRCTANIPPLCLNTCGAIIRGCFSSFYAGLDGEFDNLWLVANEVIEVTDTALKEIFNGDFSILDTPNLYEHGFILQAMKKLISQFSTCGVTFEEPTSAPLADEEEENSETDSISSGDSSEDSISESSESSESSMTDGDGDDTSRDSEGIPSDILEDLAEFRGVIGDYGDGAMLVPRFCLEQYEGNVCDGGDDDDEYCDDDEVCTRSCNCWDGENVRATDIPPYTNDEIEGQAENPVFQFNETALTLQAMALGTPVNTFLRSEAFTAPEGVEIPDADPYTEPTDGVPMVAVSMTTLLLASLLTFLL